MTHFTVERMQKASEMLAAIMWGAKSITEIVDYTGTDARTVRSWITHLMDAGVAYEAPAPMPVEVRRGRVPKVVYGLCVKPFQPPGAEPGAHARISGAAPENRKGAA